MNEMNGANPSQRRHLNIKFLVMEKKNLPPRFWLLVYLGTLAIRLAANLLTNQNLLNK